MKSTIVFISTLRPASQMEPFTSTSHPSYIQYFYCRMRHVRAKVGNSGSYSSELICNFCPTTTLRGYAALNLQTTKSSPITMFHCRHQPTLMPPTIKTKLCSVAWSRMKESVSGAGSGSGTEPVTDVTLSKLWFFMQAHTCIPHISLF